MGQLNPLSRTKPGGGHASQPPNDCFAPLHIEQRGALGTLSVLFGEPMWAVCARWGRLGERGGRSVCEGVIHVVWDAAFSATVVGLVGH